MRHALSAALAADGTERVRDRRRTGWPGGGTVGRIGLKPMEPPCSLASGPTTTWVVDWRLRLPTSLKYCLLPRVRPASWSPGVAQACDTAWGGQTGLSLATPRPLSAGDERDVFLPTARSSPWDDGIDSPLPTDSSTAYCIAYPSEIWRFHRVRPRRSARYTEPDACRLPYPTHQGIAPQDGRSRLLGATRRVSSCAKPGNGDRGIGRRSVTVEVRTAA